MRKFVAVLLFSGCMISVSNGQFVEYRKYAIIGTNNVVLGWGMHRKGAPVIHHLNPGEFSVVTNIPSSEKLSGLYQSAASYSIGLDQPSTVSFWNPSSNTFSRAAWAPLKSADIINLEIAYSNKVDDINQSASINLPNKPMAGLTTAIKNAKAKLKARGQMTNGLRRKQEDLEDIYDALVYLHGKDFKPERIEGKDASGVENEWGKQIVLP